MFQVRRVLRELGRRTGYDPGYLSNVSNGHKRPSADMAKALDDALDAAGELAALRPHQGPGPSAATATVAQRVAPQVPWSRVFLTSGGSMT
ncbi:helix-turn-helix domain-containing protein [Actinomadura macra]|uniref:helix-turn-helix domain-containing protein n=1 Tax=Actinomadura macra TaxID=46164 RepID=UPI00350E5347